MFKSTLYIILLIIAALISEGSSKYDAKMEKKTMAALEHAKKTMSTFFHLFVKCIETKMPLQQFIVDDPAKYLNGPLRTTVGSIPKYTENRRFFANLIATPQFKEMLAQDEEKYKSSLVAKMNLCKEAVMDKNAVAELYDAIVYNIDNVVIHD